MTLRDADKPPTQPQSALWPNLLRAFVTLVLIAAIIGGAAAFQRHMVATKPQVAHTPSTERARAVTAQIATPGTVQPQLGLFGQITAGRSVDLRVLVAGEVTSVAATLVEGGAVKRDEALIQVDRFEYEGALVRARAELAEAEARIVESKARIEAERAAQRRAREQEEIARRETERFDTLQGRGFTSDAALDASRSRLAASRAALEARENQIIVLEAQIVREKAALDRLRWAVRLAERNIANTSLSAPYDGIVSNVAAEVGRLLNVNDRVATLVDPSRFEVRFSLTDAQYGRLVSEGLRLDGRAVEARWRGGGDQIVIKGIVDRLSPVVTSATGGFEVYARLLPSEATQALRPGAFVSVAMNDVAYPDVLRLPQAALHPGDRLFSIGSDDRLVALPATIAGYAGDDLLLRATVLPGTRIMTSRLPDAGPGLLVRVVPAAGG